MEKKITSPWAIRDIKHGKTFHFDSPDALYEWVVNKFKPEERK